MKNVNPNDLPPLPTIDILILQRLLDRPVQSAKSLASVLGEHHSNVTTWLEKFVKAGLATRCSLVHRNGDRNGEASYVANRDTIREYLVNHKKK